MLLLAVLLAGTVGPARAAGTRPPELQAEGSLAAGTALWSGEIRVTGPVIVPKDATLRLRPGTRVIFDLPQLAADADPEPWILVLGAIEAGGTAAEPIVFTSTGRRNELENMLDVRDGARAVFRHCLFEEGPWGLHLHEAKADVEACVFRGNYGGVRLKGFGQPVGRKIQEHITTLGNPGDLEIVMIRRVSRLGVTAHRVETRST